MLNKNVKRQPHGKLAFQTVQISETPETETLKPALMFNFASFSDTQTTLSTKSFLSSTTQVQSLDDILIVTR